MSEPRDELDSETSKARPAPQGLQQILFPLPTRLAPGSNQQTQAGTQSIEYGSSFLTDALEALDHDDQKTIRSLLPATTTSIDLAFDQALYGAKQLQQRCANKRWCWDYRGRQIYLSEQVDKVVQLLDKFKSVGDVIANVDPIHVGLPWAGIRTILEVGTRAVRYLPKRMC